MANINEEIEKQVGRQPREVTKEVLDKIDPDTGVKFEVARDPASGLSADASQTYKDYLTELRTGGFEQAGQNLEQLSKTGSGTALGNIKEMFDFGLGEDKKTFLKRVKICFFPKRLPLVRL